LFNLNTAILLPPLDIEKNPTDKVTELLHASTSAEHATAFKFAIEVDVKRMERERISGAESDQDWKGEPLPAVSPCS
jgi:hypothetical protein